MRARILSSWAFAAAAAVALFAGCGGGGHSSVVPPAQPGSAAKPPASGKTQGVTIRIAIPPKSSSTGRVRTAYISPGTQSLVISVVSSPYPALPSETIQIGGSSCTPSQPPSSTLPNGSAGSCSTTVTMYTGTVASPITNLVTVQAIGPPGNSVLSEATQAVSLPQASSGPIGFSLGGVVNSIALNLSFVDGTGATISSTAGADFDGSYVPIGTPANLTVSGDDASGNTIIGTFTSPITLSSPPAGLSFSTTALSSSSGSPVIISYTGGPTFESPAPPSDTVISASGGPGLNASVTFHPSTGILTYPIAATSGSASFTSVVSDTSGNFFVAKSPASGGEILGFNENHPTAAPITITLPYAPRQLYVDSSNDLWVSEPAGGQVQCFTSPMTSGTAVTTSVPAASPGYFAFDRTGAIWIADASGTDPYMYEAPPGGSPCTLAAFTDVNLPFSAATLVVQDPTVGVWIADGSNSSLVAYATTPAPSASSAPSATSVTVSGGGLSVTGWAEDTLHSRVVADAYGATYSNFLASAVSTPSLAFNSTTEALPTPLNDAFNPPQMSGSANGGQLALVSSAYGYAALFNNTGAGVPVLSGFIGFPTDASDDYFNEVASAYDPVGLLWAVASTSSEVYAQHIVPGDWNISLAVGSAPTEEELFVGIGGGNTTDTYELTGCDNSTITCTVPQTITGPGSFIAHCNGPANKGQVQVTDETAEPKVTRTFNFYVPGCASE